MPDELRERIAILYGKRRHGHSYQDPECRIESINFADSILSLLAPILADAEKWKRFLAIQSCNDCPACPECPCDETNCPAIKIEDAFEGEGGKS